jgi:hypothetical protein
VVTVASVNSLQTQIALAERQVQRDRAQVDDDRSRLIQSQRQLERDQRALENVQGQASASASQAVQASQAAATSAPAPNLDLAVRSQAGKAPLVTATTSEGRPQINVQGQPLGKLINVVA